MGNVSMKKVKAYQATPQGTRTVIRTLEACQQITRCSTILLGDRTVSEGSFKVVDSWIGGSREGADHRPARDDLRLNLLRLLREGIVFNTDDDVDLADQSPEEGEGSGQGEGSVIEQALISFLRETLGLAGSSLRSIRDELEERKLVKYPFVPSLKRCSVLVKEKGGEEEEEEEVGDFGARLYAHGAPSAFIEALCSSCVGSSGSTDVLSSEERDRLRELIQSFSLEGHHQVLALGYRDFSPEELSALGSDLEGKRSEVECEMGLYAVFGIRPPLNAEYVSLIDEWKKVAKVGLVTAAGPETAQAVAIDAGIITKTEEEEEGVLRPGSGFQGYESTVRVVTLAQPVERAALVSSLQQRGEVVCYIGGTTSDAPALKAADVGIVLGGRGMPEVAAEAADIVIGDGQVASLAFMWNFFRK